MTWNKKRVYRVYKAEKLNLRSPKVRKEIKRVAINPLPAEQINQGWSMDFLSDGLLSNERKVRILNVLDECSGNWTADAGTFIICCNKH